METILELLSAGMSFDEVLADYEDLEYLDLLAVLTFATRLTDLGHDALHTLDLPLGNRTPDETISTMVACQNCPVASVSAIFFLPPLFLTYSQRASIWARLMRCSFINMDSISLTWCAAATLATCLTFTKFYNILHKLILLKFPVIRTVGVGTKITNRT